MNADEISKAREIAAKATPGRWNCGVDWLGDDKTSEFVCWITTEGVRIPYGTSVYTATQADKDYVELACNEFPAALDEIERLTRELAELKAATRWIPFSEQRPPEDEELWTARSYHGKSYWTPLPTPPQEAE